MNFHQFSHTLFGVESRLTENFIKIAEYYKSEPGIYYGCQEMASISGYHLSELRRIEDSEKNNPLVGEHTKSMVTENQAGTDLVRDLRFMWLLTMEALMLYNVLGQTASFLEEKDIEIISCNFERETEKQAEWLSYRINVAVRNLAVEA